MRSLYMFYKKLQSKLSIPGGDGIRFSERILIDQFWITQY
jgi:hypothetical protein